MAFIALVNSQKFDFSASGTSGTIYSTVVRGTDRSQFKSGALIVRIEDKSISASNSIDVMLLPCWPSVTSPSSDFRAATPAATLTVSNGSGAVGTTADAAFASAPDPAFDLVLKCTKGGAGDCWMVVSVGVMLFES